MQWWAEHIDSLKQPADIIDLEQAALIAEGAAQGRTISDMNALSQEEINALVADVMAQLIP